MPNPKVIAVVGPNAAGKSNYAVELARRFHGEVVSADSRQVYRRLDLGTGKITPEAMRGVPHHLMDIREPGERYSLFDFQRDARSAIDGIGRRNRLPIIAGGTGLYVAALVEGYELLDVKPDPASRRQLEQLTMDELVALIRDEQPEAMEHMGALNKRRLVRALEIIRAGFQYRDTKKKSGALDALVMGIKWEKAILHRRIGERLHARLAAGMIEEVETLRAEGVPDTFLFDMGLEYRAILRYLQGGYRSREDFIEHLETAIRQFAKRQMTWFRGRPGITWIDGADSMSPATMETVRSFLVSRRPDHSNGDSVSASESS